MRKADREALRKRIERRMERLYPRGRDWSTWFGTDYIEMNVAVEIDRAVRRERERVLGFCHDCGGEVASSPVLCTGCFRQRQDEGMDTDDMSKLETWKGRTR